MIHDSVLDKVSLFSSIIVGKHLKGDTPLGERTLNLVKEVVDQSLRRRKECFLSPPNCHEINRGATTRNGGSGKAMRCLCGRIRQK
jgi:hypothetical protein